MTLPHMPHGPIVLHVEPSEPETSTTPETLIQKFGSGSDGDEPPSSDENDGSATFHNSFGANTQVERWVSSQTINIGNLD